MTVNGSVFLQRVTAARLNAAISAIWMCVPQRDMPSRFVITTSFWPTPFTKGVGNAPFCRDSCAIVMDEAHKLPETARQMFGITLAAGELHTLCRKLRREQFLLAAETLEDTAGLLLSEIAKPWSGDSSFSHFSIPLDGVERTLSVIHRQDPADADCRHQDGTGASAG